MWHEWIGGSPLVCCEVCINMSVKGRAAWLQTLNKWNLEVPVLCTRCLFLPLRLWSPERKITFHWTKLRLTFGEMKMEFYVKLSEWFYFYKDHVLFLWFKQINIYCINCNIKGIAFVFYHRLSKHFLSTICRHTLALHVAPSNNWDGWLCLDWALLILKGDFGWKSVV